MLSWHPALCGDGMACAGRTLDNFGPLRQDGRRLAKRRHALLESNVPRNSQLETHRKAVGWGGRRLAPPTVPPRIDRFPHASKNSQCHPEELAAARELIAVGFIAVTCRSTLTLCKQEPDGTVPTMVLSETQGLQLSWVIREGIWCLLRLGACLLRLGALRLPRLTPPKILTLEPERRRTENIRRHGTWECRGSATLKLLVSSDTWDRALLLSST
jgi:hypothetical protein